MAGFFKGVTKAKGIEKPKDSLGNFENTKSDVYTVEITASYGLESSKSDAQGIKIEAKIPALNNRKLFQSWWITNKDGNTYDERDGKKKFLTGFLKADNLALLATEGEAGILDLDTEEKTIKVKRDGKEVNEVVDSFPDLIGFELQVGIIDTVKFKQNNVDGQYIEVDEKIHNAEWHTLFDIEGFTLNELEAEAEEPEFIEEWLKVWKGKVRDFTEGKQPNGGKERGGKSRRSNAEDGPKSRTANRRNIIRK